MKRASNQYIAKYKAFSPIKLKDRNWPDAVNKKAPIWCSVDLRDGNQALIEPMGEEKKLRMFNLLLNIGFKEIEVGFPAASQTDFDFIRKIIRENLIPDDVKIQVLTQSRKELIDRTFESLKGAKSAILHLYNSTSTVQRKVVFKSNKKGIKKIAEDGAKWVLENSLKQQDTNWTFQYSPESFSATELPYAAEICNAVIEFGNLQKRKKQLSTFQLQLNYQHLISMQIK